MAGADSEGTGSEGTDSDTVEPDPGSAPPKSPEDAEDPEGSSTGVSGAAASADDSEIDTPVLVAVPETSASVEVPEKVLAPVVSTEAPPFIVTTPSVILGEGSTGVWAAKLDPNLFPKVVGLGALGLPSH